MADDMRTLGYICPQCGAPVMGACPIFALEASDAEIECSCGGSVLHTRYDGQNYRLLVPCGVCGKTHEAVCPPERMLRGATALSCPDSRQSLLLYRGEGTVEHHLREAGIAIPRKRRSRVMVKAGVYGQCDHVRILSELKGSAARPDGVDGECGSRRYSMEIRRDAVELVCRTGVPGCGSAPQLTGIWTISAAT